MINKMEKFGLLPVFSLKDNQHTISSILVVEEETDDYWRDFVGYDLAKIWDEKVEEHSLTKFGDCAYLKSFEVIEQEEDVLFQGVVDYASYPEHLATIDILKENKNLLKKYYELYKNRGMDGLLHYAMPSTMKINVAVLNEWDHFLAVKRSHKVGYKKGIWTCGPNETLETFKEPNKIRAENFTSAAARCLTEEMGMVAEEDYDRLRTTSVYYDLRTMQVKIFSHAYTRLGPKRVAEKAASSQSAWEASDMEWVRISKSGLGEDIADDLVTQDGKKWSSSAILALDELNRFNEII